MRAYTQKTGTPARRPGLLQLEGTDDARVEWFTVSAEGTRALVNGVQAPAVTGPWTDVAGGSQADGFSFNFRL